jgi:hypothetical protein
MNQVVTVVFDGKVLHPDIPLDLKPNLRYKITIHEVFPQAMDEDAWDVLDELIGTIKAPPDWAGEHDHYLYGTAKRNPETQK